MTQPLALAAEDIRTDLATRGAKIKWVVVVDESLPPGLIANAAVCMAISVGKTIPQLVGPSGADASGQVHAGLPWTGCSVLSADRATIHDIRKRAAARPGIHLVDMAEQAQTSRVYDDYLQALAETSGDDLSYYGISLVGPRNAVDKLVGRLPLLR